MWKKQIKCHKLWMRMLHGISHLWHHCHCTISVATVLYYLHLFTYLHKEQICASLFQHYEHLKQTHLEQTNLLLVTRYLECFQTEKTQVGENESRSLELLTYSRGLALCVRVRERSHRCSFYHHLLKVCLLLNKCFHLSKFIGTFISYKRWKCGYAPVSATVAISPSVLLVQRGRNW